MSVSVGQVSVSVGQVSVSIRTAITRLLVICNNTKHCDLPVWIDWDLKPTVWVRVAGKSNIQRKDPTNNFPQFVRANFRFRIALHASVRPLCTRKGIYSHRLAQSSAARPSFCPRSPAWSCSPSLLRLPLADARRPLLPPRPRRPLRGTEGNFPAPACLRTRSPASPSMLPRH